MSYTIIYGFIIEQYKLALECGFISKNFRKRVKRECLTEKKLIQIDEIEADIADQLTECIPYTFIFNEQEYNILLLDGKRFLKTDPTSKDMEKAIIGMVLDDEIFISKENSFLTPSKFNIELPEMSKLAKFLKIKNHPRIHVIKADDFTYQE